MSIIKNFNLSKYQEKLTRDFQKFKKSLEFFILKKPKSA